MARGSATEVKRMCPEAAYKRILGHFAKKDWEIVAFSDSTLVLRIERENIEFDRQKGTIKERFKIG